MITVPMATNPRQMSAVTYSAWVKLLDTKGNVIIYFYSNSQNASQPTKGRRYHSQKAEHINSMLISSSLSKHMSLSTLPACTIFLRHSLTEAQHWDYPEHCSELASQCKPEWLATTPHNACHTTTSSIFHSSELPDTDHHHPYLSIYCSKLCTWGTAPPASGSQMGH